MMAAMKRYFSLTLALPLLLLALLLLPAPRTAHAADSGYAVAATSDVLFYREEDESTALFYLPYTYYVKVLSRGKEYTAVEYLTDEGPYQRIRGYCRTEALTFVRFTPARPYLYREISITYTFPQAGGFGLGNGSFASVQRTFVYYGHRYEGLQLYYYVLAGGVFDYIPMNEPLIYDYNDDFLESSGAVSNKNTSSMPAVGIVVICIGVAAAVGIAIFVLRGKKPVPPEEVIGL